ncbi:hypothetical protein [Runella salmonicolor]|uniref:Abi-like protein n=1 Tax=Runella salmonicolor TaxID=2950278 RepID=A0ABT1FR54_9BACT|nr:hypothetical protein [Runella salmonicolor]MCP1384202.1 hypothetical protein [Runella salmonicolor]
MKSEIRNKYLSRVRFNRYLSATANNSKRAERLYNANIRLSQAFHPILSQFEVVFRNGINNVLSTYFTDNEWIINQKNGFMNDTSVRPKLYLRKCVEKTERMLSDRHIPPTSGKIISDQTFGFWTAFFSTPYYPLVGGRPIQVFAHKPAAENRSSIFQKLEDIRMLRNRINHCEPICFNNHHIDCTNVLSVRNSIIDLASWIDPELTPFFKKIDNTQNKINQILTI